MIRSSVLMLLKLLIYLHEAKESLLQMIAIALFGNALWNLFYMQRKAQSMINLTRDRPLFG